MTTRSSRDVTMAVGSPTYKIILCGEYGVGKSSIFRRFNNNSFTTKVGRTATVGLDSSIQMFDIGSACVKLLLWDTGGMERMSFVGSSYYRGAQAALLCYSLAKHDSFNVLPQYILDIVMNAEGAKIFLCGNMADERGEKDAGVSNDEIDNFVSECGGVLSGVYQISCRDNRGVHEMFADIAGIMSRDFEDRMTLKRGVVLSVTDIDTTHNVYKKGKCC